MTTILALVLPLLLPQTVPTGFKQGTLTPPPIVAPAASTLVENQRPLGLIDGLNSVFTLQSIPVSGSVKLYKNGLRLTETVDFNMVGQTIMFLPQSIPQLGDVLLVDYRL